jgi:hypothetical protein
VKTPCNPRIRIADKNPADPSTRYLANRGESINRMDRLFSRACARFALAQLVFASRACSNEFQPDIGDLTEIRPAICSSRRDDNESFVIPVGIYVMPGIIHSGV